MKKFVFLILVFVVFSQAFCDASLEISKECNSRVKTLYSLYLNGLTEKISYLFEEKGDFSPFEYEDINYVFVEELNYLKNFFLMKAGNLDSDEEAEFLKSFFKKEEALIYLLDMQRNY